MVEQPRHGGQYGACNKCGYEAPDYESARVHARDKHNLLGTPTLANIGGLSGLFDNE